MTQANEEARIALIEELTAERNGIQTAINEAHQKIASLRTGRQTQTVKFDFKRAGEIDVEISQIRRTIAQLEAQEAAKDRELEAARQWNHPRLASEKFRLIQATELQRGKEVKVLEEGFRQMVTPEHAKAAQALAGTIGEAGTKALLLSVYGF